MEACFPPRVKIKKMIVEIIKCHITFCDRKRNYNYEIKLKTMRNEVAIIRNKVAIMGYEVTIEIHS